jgi:hypothetical protein
MGLLDRLATETYVNVCTARLLSTACSVQCSQLSAEGMHNIPTSHETASLTAALLFRI